MRGHDVENPRSGYVGIHVMIPDTRSSQPRDGQMKCGSQPANISMIHRRNQAPRVALLFRRDLQYSTQRTQKREASRELYSPHLTTEDHISLNNS